MDPAQYPWAYPQQNVSFDQQQLDNGYFSLPTSQQFTVAAAGAAQQKQLQHEAAMKAAAANAAAVASSSAGNLGAAEAVLAAEKAVAELNKQPEGLMKAARSKIVNLNWNLN
jgi:hypothetical protein